MLSRHERGFSRAIPPPVLSYAPVFAFPVRRQSDGLALPPARRGPSPLNLPVSPWRPPQTLSGSGPRVVRHEPMWPMAPARQPSRRYWDAASLPLRLVGPDAVVSRLL